MGTYKMQNFTAMKMCEKLKGNVAYTIGKAYLMYSIASLSE